MLQSGSPSLFLSLSDHFLLLLISAVATSPLMHCPLKKVCLALLTSSSPCSTCLLKGSLPHATHFVFYFRRWR